MGGLPDRLSNKAGFRFPCLMTSCWMASSFVNHHGPFPIWCIKSWCMNIITTKISWNRAQLIILSSNLFIFVPTFAWRNSKGLYWWRPSYCLLLFYHALPGSEGTIQAHSPLERDLKRGGHRGQKLGYYNNNN